MKSKTETIEIDGVRYPVPTIEQLRDWTFDGVCECPDGCETEPDGDCEHGQQSWLLILGYI